MIFEIDSNNIQIAMAENAKFICMSTLGEHALVMCDSINSNILIHESFADDELSNLLQNIKWKQPCKHCNDDIGGI